MLLKWCTQYVSKFEKAHSGHKTGKCQFFFFFQPQRRVTPTNTQTTVQLCSLHMLSKLCSKCFELGFTSMRTKNFQMYKLKRQRNQRSNCQHSLDNKARQLQKNTYFCFIDYTKAFYHVDCNKLWKILKEMGKPDHFTCFLRNLNVSQEATVRTVYGTDWFKIVKEVWQGHILLPC